MTAYWGESGRGSRPHEVRPLAGCLEARPDPPHAGENAGVWGGGEARPGAKRWAGTRNAQRKRLDGGGAAKQPSRRFAHESERGPARSAGQARAMQEKSAGMAAKPRNPPAAKRGRGPGPGGSPPLGGGGRARPRAMRSRRRSEPLRVGRGGKSAPQGAQTGRERKKYYWQMRCLGAKRATEPSGARRAKPGGGRDRARRGSAPRT